MKSMSQQSFAHLKQQVGGKAKSVLTDQVADIALSIALPREYPARRLPTRPASYTAVLESMALAAYPVPDADARRAVLVRDPVYPAWAERTCVGGSAQLKTDGGGWSAAAANTLIVAAPAWEKFEMIGSMGIDNAVADLSDFGVLFQEARSTGLYVPYGSQLTVTVGSAAVQTGGTCACDLTWRYRGEWVTTTVRLDIDPGTPTANMAYSFSGYSGTVSALVGGVIESPDQLVGTVPWGWVYATNFRTVSAPTPTIPTPYITFGWAPVGRSWAPLAGPGTSMKLLVPLTRSPEFSQSLLPYSRCRVTASSLLLSNVTAEMYREGTVKAARLCASNIGFSSFSSADVDAVHPTLKYYGRLADGAYTFTLPLPNCDSFHDCWISLTTNSTATGYKTVYPLAQVSCYEMYNALVLQDNGSGSTLTTTFPTQLAVTVNQHIEFESTTSLFELDLSRTPLQTLQAAEVALLRFGLFHENWIHVGKIVDKALQAVRWATPLVAPQLGLIGNTLINAAAKAGTDYLARKLTPEAKASANISPGLVIKPRSAPAPSKAKRTTRGK